MSVDPNEITLLDSGSESDNIGGSTKYDFANKKRLQGTRNSANSQTRQRQVLSLGMAKPGNSGPASKKNTNKNGNRKRNHDEVVPNRQNQSSSTMDLKFNNVLDPDNNELSRKRLNTKPFAGASSSEDNHEEISRADFDNGVVKNNEIVVESSSEESDILHLPSNGLIYKPEIQGTLDEDIMVYDNDDNDGNDENDGEKENDDDDDDDDDDDPDLIPHPKLNMPLSSSSYPLLVSSSESESSDFPEVISKRAVIDGDLTRQSIYNAVFFLKVHGMKSFIRTYLPRTATPSDLRWAIRTLGGHPCLDEIGNDTNDLVEILRYKVNCILRNRIRLDNFYSESDVLDLLTNKSKILVLTGAGISTSLGIPDFRSSQGFYSKLNDLGLTDPQDVFSLEQFTFDPSIFYSIAHMILPPTKAYTPLHSFIKLLSSKNKLLRNYTQNIDNLEANAGIPSNKVIQCHGSFATATCVTCGFQVDGEHIRKDILQKTPSFCPLCIKKRMKLEQKEIEFEESFGVFKPDITFFGESLPKKFHDNIKEDIMECDLLICIGTSLEVAPVADIVKQVHPSVPQVLINKDPINHHVFDVSYLGYCDDVASHLCSLLNWELQHEDYHKILGPDNRNLVSTCLNEYDGLYSVVNIERENKQKLEAKSG